MVSTPLDPEFCTLNNEVGIENFGLTQQGIQASVDQKLDHTIGQWCQLSRFGT